MLKIEKSQSGRHVLDRPFLVAIKRNIPEDSIIHSAIARALNACLGNNKTASGEFAVPEAISDNIGVEMNRKADEEK